MTEEGAEGIALALARLHRGWRIERRLQSRLAKGADWLMVDVSDDSEVVLEVGGTDRSTDPSMLLRTSSRSGTRFERRSAIASDGFLAPSTTVTVGAAMPIPRRPHVASPDEIRITREGDAAIIEYADPAVAVTHFTIGKKKLEKMSDPQILRMWNTHIRLRDELMAEYEHVCFEIPLGKPQVTYEELSDQWVPRGDVLRTRVLGATGDEDLDEPFVTIDNRDYSIREFVRMVGTFSGWGMRIAFVPDDELHEEPVIEVREPDNRPGDLAKPDDWSGPDAEGRCMQNPNTGGVRIPTAVKQETKTRLLKHAEKHYAGSYKELVIRFRGQFCYVDALLEDDVEPIHLCRLRYFKHDRWSLGFFAYSSEKYELAVFPSGDFYGTPEEALDVGAMYLRR